MYSCWQLMENKLIFRNLCLFSILGMFLSFTFTGQPSFAQKSSKFKVHVGVSSEDEHTKSLIQSWIKRDLRSLGDVVIVGFDDSQWVLAIVAVETTYQATGRKSGGIAIGSMFLRKAGISNGLYYYPDLLVSTDDTKDLEQLCKGIVADLDTRRLEPIRELFH